MNGTITEVWYIVQVLRHWDSLTVLGLPLAGEKDAPGCVGFMPIFRDIESAKAWRTEHNHPTAAIAAITREEAK